MWYLYSTSAASVQHTRVHALAYPEPIPEIADRDAREFLKRLKAFRLSGSQRELFRDAFRVFSRDRREKK